MKGLDDILAKFVSPKEIYAVTCKFESDGLSWSMAHLKVKKGSVELLDTAFSRSLNGLLEGEESRPAVLLLMGKKVLTKSAVHSADSNSEAVFEKTFPNVNPEDVFFQFHDTDQQKKVSVIRKESLQEILSNLNSEKQDLIDIGIGEDSFAEILEHLSEEEQQAVGAIHSNEEDVPPPSINMMGYSVPPQCISSFLFGIHFFSRSAQSAELEVVEDARKEWRYKVLFKKTMTFGSVGLFALLLINFLLFTHYTSLNQELEIQTSGYDGQIAELEKLREDHEKMKSFLEVNGSDDGQLAMMGDQLAAIVPKEVALSRMSFNPMERHLKRENLYRYNQGVILIEGSTKRYTDFGDWVSQVKQLNWVKSVDIVGYEESASDKEGQFSIKITIV